MRREMFITEYSVSTRYMDDDIRKGNDHCVAADVSTSHRYYNAHITIYPTVFEMWKKGDKEEVAEVIIHEMCHILTDPLYKIANDASSNASLTFVEDAREQITQKICIMLMANFREYNPTLIGLKKKKKILKKKSKKHGKRKSK